MNKTGRTTNSLRNMSFGLGSQIINVILRFAVRTFFIHSLNSEYLGVNGLFSNILTMLSIAELGVGSAIVYNMYRPIAENDEKQVSKLMSLYQTAYCIIGSVVLLIGLTLTPFLEFIIDGKTEIDNLQFIYILFVLDSGISYFFSYKRSMLSADQNEYILHIFKSLFDIARSVVQICILLLMHNYLLYLMVQIISTFTENLCISIYVDKKYPFLKKYRHERLRDDEKKTIYNNIGSLMIYKIGSRFLDGTDNIIISAFVGVVPIGILSNYTLINGSLGMVSSKVAGALTASVGNYIAKESHEHFEKLLKRMMFINYLMFGFIFIMSFTLFNPFITFWIGEKFLFTKDIVFIIALNEYIYGMMNAIWVFRSTMGLFSYGKWRPLVSAAINVGVSIILAKQMGVLGVLLGTTITRILTNVWYDPMIVYKHGIEKKPYGYYYTWAKYLLVILLDIVLVEMISRLVNTVGIVQLMCLGCIAAIVFFVSIIIFFYHSDEFNYFISVTKQAIKRRI